ncbi:Cytoskeleton-associated protein 2 [Collichthys lucidus]|uniref:Cytoskeleton-associated protein 2 n=1 Tax=Collichthys lucidus TaxID=240159 RepID=A0A4U5V893_COLLU|nr:Cytoskeleton-associated protein 2 [Collichthys lucidus]
MDVTVSKRNHKKENKENAQPKSFIKREKPSAPSHLKSSKREETLAKNVLQAKARQADTRSTSSSDKPLKKVLTVQRDGTDVQRQTHSRAFLAEKAVKDKKIIAAEAPQQPAAAPSSKSAPGMYKGKIIESKIGSIWKSSATVSTTGPKPESQRGGKVTQTGSTWKSSATVSRTGPKPESQKVGKVTQTGSTWKSSATGSRTGPKPESQRVGKVAQTGSTWKSSATLSRAGFKPESQRVGRVTKIISADLPKIPATDKKVNRPVVSSTLSQYRMTAETAEERRAKLAQWQASKGKSFKRPAMTAAAPPKTKVCAKPKANLQPESQPAARRNPEPEPSVEAHKPASDAQGAESTTRSRTPAIMDTTVDLLSNSDADLPVDPQDRMDDIVVNLCDALEAMSTPSTCQDVLPQVTDVCSAVEVKESDPEDECRKEELKNETPEDVSEQPTVEQVKDEGEESESETEGDEDDEEEVDSDDCVMESTPQREEASVVKYSVKTTPYLQSIKKTIEDDVSASASRRKSNIKDLKFLTPVRRSSRIQRTSSRLPAMLMDHDPCVSSLAELVKMDDDPNAYIYRKNPALLEDLPDQPRL